MAGGTLNMYQVEYHFEQGSPQRNASPNYTANLLAADNAYTTLKTILVNNSLIYGPGTLVIDSCEATPSGTQTGYIA